MRFPLLAVCALLLLGSCTKESESATPGITQVAFANQIQGRGWIESHEDSEQNSDIRVFRPDTYAFPPSWPRNGFRFDAEGVFVGRGPSPTDGIAVYPGRWTATDNLTFRITPSGASLSYGLQLISLQDDVLKVRRTE